MAIVIYDKATDRRLFTIRREQLDELVEALEEEGIEEDDHEYYIDEAVCGYLDGRIDPEVLEKLRAAVSEAEAPDEDVVEGPETADRGGEEGDEEEELEEEDDEEEDDDEYEEDEGGQGIDIYWREE